MTLVEINDTRDELEQTIKNQLEVIEMGDFETAQELEQDITYLKGQLKDFTPEYSHIM